MYSEKRYYELIDLINNHNRNYYLLDNPTISDSEWDKLYDELLAHENALGFIASNSPSQRVGDVILSGFKKFEHTSPLLSLSKSNDMQSLKKWYDDVNKIVPNAKFSVECKFDGLRMTVTYKNGNLVSAATRGDGYVGEDVTAQIMQINNVPKHINYDGDLTVEGEALMRLSVLEEYNKTASEVLKNARNAAAGAIRNLDLKVIRNRNLDVYFYGVTEISDKSLLKSQKDVFEFLKVNGFEVFEHWVLADNFDDIFNAVNEIDIKKSKFDVLLDGAVIKLNPLKERELIGYTSKFPKWAIAYKFEAEEVTTILENVVWQVGRTGKITPIGEIEAVELAGATVRRATLNNFGDITRKDLKINSRVFVRRSNEVIPEILGVSEHLDNSIDIMPPTNCPSCDSLLIIDGANLFCKNSHGCKEQIVNKIVHFANKRGMDIRGLNDKIVLQLYENKLIKNISDLYLLTYDDLLKLEGFKDKKATNLLNSLEASKDVKLHNFIYSLGINGIGEKTSKDLAKYFKTLTALSQASVEELLLVDEVGEILANSIKTWFEIDSNKNLLSDLFMNGIKLEEYLNKPEVLTNNDYYGKTFVITGRFDSFSRDELKDKLENIGARVSDSVSKKTDYLVKGEDSGSKYQKALTLNVAILEESDIIDILKA